MFGQKNILDEPLVCFKNERYYENTRGMNKNDAKYLLSTLNRVYKENGIDLFLNYGTLLGAVREHDFISHDFDIDTAIWAKDMQKALDLSSELEKFEIHLHCYVLPWIFTYEYKGVTCDIDVLNEAILPWRLRYCLLNCKYIEKSFFENTTSLKFLGEVYIVPAHSEKLLEYYYGKTWRIPSNNPGRTESYFFFWRYADRYLHRCIRYVKRHWFSKKEK